MADLTIRQLSLTTHEVNTPHLLIEYSDGSVVCLRKDQADVLFDEARKTTPHPQPQHQP